ncbi:MAG: hypothetical protein JWM16_4708, partial [Verrucomicrobiales bacterium]|nr:hypothetical protein [Verrucomicrobiales bacterium]
SWILFIRSLARKGQGHLADVVGWEAFGSFHRALDFFKPKGAKTPSLEREGEKGLRGSLEMRGNYPYVRLASWKGAFPAQRLKATAAIS